MIQFTILWLLNAPRVYLCNSKCMLAKCCLTVTMVSNLLYLSHVSFPYLFLVCAFHMNTVSAWLHLSPNLLSGVSSLLFG